MSFFISDAVAEGAQAAPPTTDLSFFIMLIGMFAIFYFMIIRPQSKKAKEQKAMLDALSKGDEIVTNGGILGKVTGVGDNFVEVEIGKDNIIRLQRHAVANIMPKGTIKEATKDAS